MIPLCTSALDTLTDRTPITLKKTKTTNNKEESSTTKSPRNAFKKRQRQSLWGKQAGFGVVLVNGQVRISTIIFILCLIEATLWTSCLLSSHSALKTDTLEAEHYLIRETENLKNFDLGGFEQHQRIPQFIQSYLLKQHIDTERLWAQREQSVWNDVHLNWNTPKTFENFQLEEAILDKGVPGPFAGVKAID